MGALSLKIEGTTQCLYCFLVVSGLFAAAAVTWYVVILTTITAGWLTVLVGAWAVWTWVLRPGRDDA